MSNTAETRVVSATGGQKGSKLARFDLLPGAPLWELAEHYGKGAAKYTTYEPCDCDQGPSAHTPECASHTVAISGDRNWELGTDWHLNFAAAMRHLWAFWNGEDFDPEMGSKHVIAAAWHCFALAQFMDTHPELDTRPTTLAARDSWRRSERL